MQERPWAGASGVAKHRQIRELAPAAHEKTGHALDSKISNDVGRGPRRGREWGDHGQAGNYTRPLVVIRSGGTNDAWSKAAAGLGDAQWGLEFPPAHIGWAGGGYRTTVFYWSKGIRNTHAAKYFSCSRTNSPVAL